MPPAQVTATNTDTTGRTKMSIHSSGRNSWFSYCGPNDRSREAYGFHKGSSPAVIKLPSVLRQGQSMCGN
jgi:hypothetical protein